MLVVGFTIGRRTNLMGKVYTHLTNDCTIIINYHSLVPYICFGPHCGHHQGYPIIYIYTSLLAVQFGTVISLLFCRCYYFTLKVLCALHFVGCHVSCLLRSCKGKAVPLQALAGP
jgi:hypothetical protein